MIRGLGNLYATGNDLGIQIQDVSPRPFIAQVISYAPDTSGSGTGTGSNRVGLTCGASHGWREMRMDPTGSCYCVKEDGRTGTTSFNPAYELNGRAVEPGTLVLMWERGWTATDRGTVHDFLAPGSTASDMSSGSASASGLDSGSGSAGPTCIPFISGVSCVNGAIVTTTKWLTLTHGRLVVHDSPPAGCSSGSSSSS